VISVSIINICPQYVNPAHERLFGYSIDECIGKNSREIGKCDDIKADSSDCMNGQLRKGKVSHFPASISYPSVLSMSSYSAVNTQNTIEAFS
jgi:PAS domain-containing protein